VTHRIFDRKARALAEAADDERPGVFLRAGKIADQLPDIGNRLLQLFAGALRQHVSRARVIPAVAPGPRQHEGNARHIEL
jgi:hypothetical protein